MNASSTIWNGLGAGFEWRESPLNMFRYPSNLHRNVAASLILYRYGDRTCGCDPTSPSGKYQPRDSLAERAINGWCCAMSAAKYDRYRTAKQRAECLFALDVFDEYFGDYRECSGCIDAALQAIMVIERFASVETFKQ